jgi:signal peptidase II
VRNLWKKVCQWYWNHAYPIGAVACVFLIDRFTKLGALFWLQDSAIELFPFFHLRYVENTGAAFGMMQNGNLWLIFIMIGIVSYLLKSWKELCSYGKMVEWGCIFILAGALGNLYDRITLGYVVDFLDFRVWPVFNVADSFITIGGCLFVISLFTCKKEQGESK